MQSLAVRWWPLGGESERGISRECDDDVIGHEDVVEIGQSQAENASGCV